VYTETDTATIHCFTEGNYCQVWRMWINMHKAQLLKLFWSRQLGISVLLQFQLPLHRHT